MIDLFENLVSYRRTCIFNLSFTFPLLAPYLHIIANEAYVYVQHISTNFLINRYIYDQQSRYIYKYSPRTRITILHVLV